MQISAVIRMEPSPTARHINHWGSGEIDHVCLPLHECLMRLASHPTYLRPLKPLRTLTMTNNGPSFNARFRLQDEQEWTRWHPVNKVAINNWSAIMIKQWVWFTKYKCGGKDNVDVIVINTWGWLFSVIMKSPFCLHTTANLCDPFLALKIEWKILDWLAYYQDCFIEPDMI